ncbi:hypothetical protein ACQPTN_10690 [Bradyrhizobium sp. 13971]
MVCPTLISVSPAPGSYFFCALAAEIDSAMVSAVAMVSCTLFLIRSFLSSACLFQRDVKQSFRAAGASLKPRGRRLGEALKREFTV